MLDICNKRFKSHTTKIFQKTFFICLPLDFSSMLYAICFYETSVILLVTSNIITFYSTVNALSISLHY